ncbi:MAG: exopolysaccharide biosynthesis protein [Elusimicrobia bacterium]|nr:exopolysaccharide biosynthesis protein [Elusimicrobiota bacterium]
MKAPSRLSAELERLARCCSGGRMRLRELLPGLQPRDQALLTATLSICFMHPVPMPGVSTVFGLAIAAIGARMALGLGPWIPGRWLDRDFPGPGLQRVFRAGSGVVRRLERFIKPRGLFISAHPWVLRLNGAAIAVCGLLLAMPAPPGTNFPPAAALFLLSIGTLEADALWLAAGYGALALNALFFGALLGLGWGGVKALLG